MSEGAAGKRTVAFLDILGFKELLSQLGPKELGSRYEKLVATASWFSIRQKVGDASQLSLFRHRQFGERTCIKKIFSDSIILVSLDDSSDAALAVLINSWRLSQVFLAAGMPLRGGVAFGDMYVNEPLEVFLGDALTRAYKLESSQDWIGISIEDEIEETFEDIRIWLATRTVLRKYDVPLKNGSSRRLSTLNWRWNMVVQKGTRSLFQPTGDDQVKVKINHALAYAKDVIDDERTYSADGKTTPIELRVFWVGDREPPFPHGDDL